MNTMDPKTARVREVRTTAAGDPLLPGAKIPGLRENKNRVPGGSPVVGEKNV
jgi:hypothetical protein